MSRNLLIMCAGTLGLLFLPFTRAQSSPSAPSAVASTPPSTPTPAPVLGQSVGLGLDLGGFGGAASLGLRVRFPLGRSFALVVRPLMFANEATPYAKDGGPRADVGGRIELVGMVEAFARGVRLYGGGGPQVFYSIAGAPSTSINVGGGGHFGFEFFVSENVSMFAEIGGSTGSDRKYGDGGSAVGGVNLYL